MVRGVFVPREAAGLFDALDRARRGDVGALETWNREARPLVVAALRRYGLDADAAEDVTQETVLAAMDSLDRGKPARDDASWLSTVSTRKARRELRRRNRLLLGEADADRMSGGGGRGGWP